MIFVTAGTQIGFDRLILNLDSIFSKLDIKEEVIVQTVDFGNFKLTNNFTFKSFLSPQEFENYFNNSKFVIGHAGMGTVLKSLQNQKPLIVFPRRLSHGEHRNDHQMATVAWLKKLDLVSVAMDKKELQSQVLHFLQADPTKGLKTIGPFASKTLLDEIKKII